jgi:hypothetical protein
VSTATAPETETETTATNETAFLNRFERIWNALRRSQVREGLWWSTLAAALGLGGLALADDWLELSLTVRGIGLDLAGVLTLVVFWRAVVAPLRWWTRPRTAAEIEARFPQLGQRIRTLVQYGRLPDDRLALEGVTPSLLAALSEETDSRADPLPLDAIVPRWRVRAVALLAVVPIVAIVARAVVDPEWRIALERALLSDRAYTTIVVTPGDVTVEQGARLAITAELSGRPRSSMVLQTRPAGTAAAAPWKTIALEASPGGPATRRTTTLEKIRDPLVYRVVAGPISSRTARINVRYPLALTLFEVTLTPPAYTGLTPTTEKGGDLRVVEGTEAAFRIAFNDPVRDAALVVTDPNAPAGPKDAPPPAPQVIPLAPGPQGQALTARLRLTRELDYQVVAHALDGRPLPKNSYRIDTRADRPPRVGFEQPDEALEVHPIAEVLHRIRVADDFGLSKAGIVYRINDGEERTLISKDFATQARPGSSSDSVSVSGTARPVVDGQLEETLMLETLDLTPTDSITYYAFAEDNHPGGPKRTETDLRYIDIRPFKRSYLIAQGESPQSTTLNELIARQRFNLNRTVRLARHRPGDRAAPEDPLKIASFEELLAALTREVAEGLEGIDPDRFEAVRQAEAAMVAAVNALDHEKHEEACPLEAEALRHLVEARRTIEFAMGQGNGQAMSEALRSYDRIEAQKIRQPRSEAEEAEALVAEIEKLAGDEDFVYATIKSLWEQPPGNSDNAQAQAQAVAAAATPMKGDKGQVGSEQQRIADQARALAERLKRLEPASELSRLRMTKAAEAAERAAGALGRGRSQDAAEQAKGGALLLREVARQVKGEIAREVADQLAMARDLAEELAQREAELGAKAEPAEGSDPGSDPASGSDPDPAKGTEAEPLQLQRLAEMARTLEDWLKQLARRGEGKVGAAARELLEQGKLAEIIARIDRIATQYAGGEKAEARRGAAEVARELEAIAQALDKLHRDLVAPRLATLMEYDRQLAELDATLKRLETDPAVNQWHRQAEALLRELQAKEAMTGPVAELEKAMADAGWHIDGGTWRWGDRDIYWAAPASYKTAIARISKLIQDKIQEMILKDMISSRDEATPPEFKELVERYYEVLSKESGSGSRSGAGRNR